jgi:hypothetical protein
MPAGNDATNAARALADSVGQGGKGADEMIKASRDRYRGDLGKAQLLSEVDEELDLGAVAKAAGVETVISATRRGDFVVYLSEGEKGIFKDVLNYSDLSKPKSAPKPKAQKSSRRKKSEESSSDE